MENDALNIHVLIGNIKPNTRRNKERWRRREYAKRPLVIQLPGKGAKICDDNSPMYRNALHTCIEIDLASFSSLSNGYEQIRVGGIAGSRQVRQQITWTKKSKACYQKRKKMLLLNVYLLASSDLLRVYIMEEVRTTHAR